VFHLSLSFRFHCCSLLFHVFISAFRPLFSCIYRCLTSSVLKVRGPQFWSLRHEMRQISVPLSVHNETCLQLGR
jgi:hypothetical protein